MELEISSVYHRNIIGISSRNHVELMHEVLEVSHALLLLLLLLLFFFFSPNV
jgi:hypothetical protein